MEHVRIGGVLACLALMLAGCQRPATEGDARGPQQAGQPLDPLRTAARIVAARGSAMVGDQEGVRANMEALHEDFRRSIKLADPARRVDHETARMAARGVEGVRSVAWIDHENLLAMVEQNEQRSYLTIDRICLELEPLGDTLGVVVNLQSAAARSGDELEILSRNCQLAPGDRAFLQRDRQVDVIAPHIRAQHKVMKTAIEGRDDRSADQDEAMRILEETTPEM